MIEIIPFNRTLFNNFEINESKLTKYIYITDINLISKLLSMDLPIDNKKIALRNIFDFLSYIDNLIYEYGETLIPISSNVLISFFNRDRYIDYIKLLDELNIMTRVPYQDGKYYKAPIKKESDKWLKLKKNSGLCSQFRIHNQYLNKEELAIVILEDDRSKDKFNNEIENLDPRYIKTIKHLEIDINKAIKAEIEYFNEKCLTISNLRKRISRIFYTKRKRFIKKGKKVDRIYHSFTNVSRVSRKYLNINMKDIDIVNCQPLLLVAYLNSINLSYDLNYQISY